jgi:hypothetical protein
VLNIEIEGRCILCFAFQFITVSLMEFPFVLGNYDLQKDLTHLCIVLCTNICIITVTEKSEMQVWV